MIDHHRAAALAAIASVCLLGTSAEAALTLTGPSYSQDFNTLATSGTANSTLPDGWQILEAGSGARVNQLYAADNGSSNTGDTYSYGTAGSGERALGSLASGSIQSQYGALFLNGTGSALSGLTVGYTGEQWRFGGTAGDLLTFQYSLDATNLSNGTWTNVSALNFASIVNAGTAGALDGNATANRTAISATIAGLAIASGGNFGIRWTDADSLGSDDGMAIDDLSLTLVPAVASAPSPVPEPASWAMCVAGFGLLGGTLRRHRPAALLA